MTWPGSIAAMNSGSSRNQSAAVSESQPATSAPSDSAPAKTLTARSRSGDRPFSGSFTIGSPPR